MKDCVGLMLNDFMTAADRKLVTKNFDTPVVAYIVFGEEDFGFKRMWSRNGREIYALLFVDKDSGKLYGFIDGIRSTEDALEMVENFSFRRFVDEEQLKKVKLLKNL